MLAFDEYTRMVDGWLAHLAYLDEEKTKVVEQAVKRGIELGIEEGIKQGIENFKIKEELIVELVKEGHLTKESAAEVLSLTVKDFERYLQE